MPSWGKYAIKKHNLDHKKFIGPTINTSDNASDNISPYISPNISENINKKNNKNKLVTKDDLNNKEKYHVLLYIDYEITPIDVIIRELIFQFLY